MTEPASKPAPAPSGPGGGLNEKQRTLALAGTAGLLVVVLAIRMIHSSATGAGEPVSAGRPTATASTVPFSAVGVDAAELAKHYKPIVDAEPFKEHPFLKKKPRRDEKGNLLPDDVASTTSGSNPYPSSTPPGMVSLRLTGIFEDAGVALALLEDRSTGKGFFLKKGDRLGSNLADVVSQSLVLAKADVAPNTSAATISVILGEKVDVRVEDVTQKLKAIGPPPAFRDSSGNLLPVLNEAEKDSVLERLRKKRQASLGGEPAKSLDAPAPAESPKPTDAPKDTPKKEEPKK